MTPLTGGEIVLLTLAALCIALAFTGD